MQLKNLIRKVSFVLTAGALFFMSSCKKERNEPAPQAPAALKKITTGDESMAFEYNADGTVHKATIKSNEATNGEVVNYTVIYNSAKQITEIMADNDEKIIPVYENGKLVRSYLKTNLGEELGFTEYEDFNATNKAATFYTEIDGIICPLIMQLFKYDAAGNIEKTSFYLRNPLAPNALVFTGSITCSYDTKVNPLANAADLLKLLWIAVPKNNVLREIHNDKDGILEEAVEYTYQYNSNAVPGSGTVKRLPAGGVENTKSIQFTY